jgi:hypothetical protein
MIYSKVTAIACERYAEQSLQAWRQSSAAQAHADSYLWSMSLPNVEAPRAAAATSMLPVPTYGSITNDRDVTCTWTQQDT